MTYANNEEDGLRIRVAELTGMTDIYYRKPDIDNRLVGMKKDSLGWIDVPEYATDLNVMHEAEKIIDDPFVRRRYYQALDEITGNQWNTIVATAKQRATAFIRAMEENYE